MLDFATHELVLFVSFLVIACAYSSVGLGGGSSYTALLALFGVSFVSIPTISLLLNIVVTTVGSMNFIRHNHARMRLILPFLVSSIPAAYLGGTLLLPKMLFYWILLGSLGFVALRIYLWDSISISFSFTEKQQLVLSLISGAVLGLIAGIVGIGGGIYLVPLILILGLGTAKEAAACGAIFVWLNSVSGFMARIQHGTLDITLALPLVFAVLIGGGVGSFLGAQKLNPKLMEKILGAIILIAIFFLGRKIFLLM